MRMLQKDYSCDFPNSYYVDPSSSCNLRCKFCPTGLHTGQIGTGLMSLENFQIILDKINPYAEEIHLYNYGEPFLNKNLIEMISLTAQKKIKTVIHSNLNARIFDENEAKAIVKSGLSELSVSIDGATQDTYEKYRIGGNIEKVFANIQQIVKAKKQLKSKRPFIKWSFLINKHNEHQIDLAKQKAKALGITIGYTLMDVWGEKEWESSYHLDQGKFARLKKRVAIDRVLNGPGRIESVLRILKEASASVQKKLSKKQCLPTNADTIVISNRFPFFCVQPFNKMIVNWNGDVLPCCAVADGKAKIGNLVTQDLETVWNNAAMRKCRMFLLNADARLDLDSVCESGACTAGQLNRT